MGNLVGVMIVNGYLKTPKFEEIRAMYEAAATACDITLISCYTSEIVYGIRDGKAYNSLLEAYEHIDFVLFLDKDIHLASNLETLGIRVFNSSKVIEVCDNKGLTFQSLSGHHIAMPDTVIAPLVYPGTYKPCDEVYVRAIGDQLGYPLVVKESFGSFGEQVYLVSDYEELWQKHQQLSDKPHIYQQFIASSRGRDVRVNVVGGEVVASMLRFSETDFRANITNGGQMQAWNCPEAFETMALKVCEVLKIDFAGVDLLFGNQGEPILCEVNSNAHIKNILMCTGVNVAESIIGYIQKECDL
ncbi:MAG: RimK family alpha-L-glutamate ligase [Cellulosilyticaceae bacterium]